jgi:hypothetical protein
MHHALRQDFLELQAYQLMGTEDGESEDSVSPKSAEENY